MPGEIVKELERTLKSTGTDADYSISLLSMPCGHF
jgi:hypothetical protein